MSKLALTPWDIVRARAFEAGGFIDSHPDTSSEQTIQVFIDEAGDPKNARLMRDTVGQKSTLHDYLPSLYTGGMRKLMQVSHLRGESLFYASGHDSFLPDWADTYGVWISSPVDGFCNRYIIRICSSGVYRIPITFSRQLPADWQSIEAAAASLPPEEAAQTVGRMWSAGDFNADLAVKIADTPLMYSDGNGGIYGTCGWAFNTRGTSAVNVGVRIDPDDPFAARRQANLYQLTITESDGVPVGATCMLMESGELVNAFDDTDPLKGPAIIQVASNFLGERGYCQTFPCYPGLIGPRLFSTNTPVFAYYVEDTMHVVRFTPDWSESAYNDSVSKTTAIGDMISSTDTTVGNLSKYAASDPDYPFPAVDYPSSVLGAQWGIASGNRLRTMRFSSPLVTPVAVSKLGSNEDNTLETYGAGFYAGGASFPSVFMGIQWDVTETDVMGYVSNYKEYRTASLDSLAESRIMVTGTVQKVRNYAESDANHQVLLLHGFDRTSYAVYTRRDHRETGVAVSYTGSPIAVPDAATMQYNGGFSGNTWVDHAMSSYHVDTFNSEGDHIVKICEGVTRYPSGLLITHASGGNSVSPPSGTTDPDLLQLTFDSSFAVVGGTAFALGFDGNDPEKVYLEGAVFYKAGGSFNSARAFYQDKENLTGANVVGVGTYGAAVNRLTCFVGWF